MNIHEQQFLQEVLSAPISTDNIWLLMYIPFQQGYEYFLKIGIIAKLNEAISLKINDLNSLLIQTNPLTNGRSQRKYLIQLLTNLLILVNSD